MRGARVLKVLVPGNRERWVLLVDGQFHKLPDGSGGVVSGVTTMVEVSGKLRKPLKLKKPVDCCVRFERGRLVLVYVRPSVRTAPHGSAVRSSLVRCSPE